MGALGARWRGTVGMARDWVCRVANERRMQDCTCGKKAATSVVRLALQILLEDHLCIYSSKSCPRALSRAPGMQDGQSSVKLL